MTKDEFKHFIVCLIISALILVLFRIEFNPLGWKVWHWYNYDAGLAFVLTSAIAIGKEVIYDKLLGKGTPQFYDAVWGVIGAILGPGIVLLVEGIVTEVL